MDIVSYILSKKTVSELEGKLGSAAYLNAPEEGHDADNDEVVLGSDSRLNGSQPPAPHTHVLADITDAGTAAAYDIPVMGDALANEVVMGDDSRLTDSRDPNPHTHTMNDISDFPSLGTAAEKDWSNTYDPTSEDLITSKAVGNALNTLPNPMIFKGSLGEGGTISQLPAAVPANEGFTYKVITDGTYAGCVAHVGDSFTSDGSVWVHFPSGDEPGGTVMSVKIQGSGAITVDDESAITTSGVRTISHNDSGVNAGTYTSVTVDGKGHVTAGSNPDISYNDLTDKPTLGTAAAFDVADSGDALANEVVMGDDSRLTDARNASDVYSWAKAENKPTYTKSEIGLGNVDNTSDVDKPISTAAQAALDNKVDKINGKGLSTNDYTTAEKNKLAGVENGAEANIQADWDEDDNTSDAYIVNKPQNLVQDANYVHTDNNYTTTEKNKLSSIATGAEVNVQSNWTENDDTSDAYIANKPTLGTAAALNVSVSGDASSTEVVKGNDSRLTDSRTPKSHTHTLSDITDAGTAASKNIPASGNASSTEVVMGDDTRLTDSRTPKSHTHTKSEITDFPTLGTASEKNVPSSGNASTTEVVMGNDTRLTNDRNAADVYPWAKEESKPTYTASDVGLGNVDNTADLDKPISTATQEALNNKVDKVSGKGLSENDYTTAEKNKLSGIAAGAEVNQNAFSNVKVGTSTVAADGKTDTFELIAGSNITLTPDTTNDAVTITATDTTYNEATTSTAGLMSSSDKTKLNGISTGAEVNQNAFSNVKVGSTTVAADAKTDTLELVAGSNITLTPDATNDKVTIAATDTNTTYEFATGDSNGQIKVTPSGSSAQNVSVKGLGDAAYKSVTTSVTSGSDDLVTSGAVASAIDAMPEPMIFKGTLGTGGTITTLPTAAKANEGHTYKVITAGIYASQTAKVGDMFVSAKPEGASSYSWVYIPSGDDTSTDTDTWRNIKVNGTEKLGNGISTGGVDFVNGTNTTVSFDTSGNKISISATDTNTHRPINVNGTQTLGDNTTALNLKNGSNVSITSSGGDVTINATDTTYSEASTTAAGLMSSSDKTKLNGIATGAEVNQNAFSNIKVGSTTVQADAKTDTLEFVAGSNVTITPDAINDKITIAATDTTYTDASTSASGLMSSSDKTKLNGIATGAEVNQNAFSNVKVGSTTIAADTKTDTLELVAGTNVTLTPNDTNDSVTITASDTDTKNTAGSTDTSSKIFLVGATSQAANPQTYSHDTAYVGTDGCLYSGGIKVLTSHQDISGKADKSDTVSTVAWSSNKLTKTINGATTDVVTAATILGNLTKSQVTTALGYTPPTSDTNTHRPININGTQTLGDNTTALNLKNGSNVSITSSGGDVTISATDTTYGIVSSSTNGLAPKVTDTGKFLQGNGTWSKPETSYIITPGDQRAVATTPNDYANKFVFQGLKTNGYINSPSSDSYSYLFGLRGWSDSSGGNSWELAFNNSGIFTRNGASTTWGSWSKLAHTSDIVTYTFDTGDSNGKIKVTPSAGNAYDVAVKGLGSAAYTASTDYATSGHTHSAATTSAAGFMSSADKTKLDGINTSIYMVKGTDYVTAGKKSGSTLGTKATAEGYDVVASGNYSHAEGSDTTANGLNCHAEGSMTYATNQISHAEGKESRALGIASHAEGRKTTVDGSADYAHAEGYQTFAGGEASHAEGFLTVADYDYAHAEGKVTTASRTASHAEGTNTLASNQYAHAEGYYTNASGESSHAEGCETIAKDNNSHAEGNATTAFGVNSHAEGYSTSAAGDDTHAEGHDTIASGESSHAEGVETSAIGSAAHAEGYYTYTNGDYSHSEGIYTCTNGEGAHAEGYSATSENYIIASAEGAHAEGYVSTMASEVSLYLDKRSIMASGKGSHAEGMGSYATNIAAHAEGCNTCAYGIGSHTEGLLTKASDYGAHAEGGYNDGLHLVRGGNATGRGSHAEGINSAAAGDGSHAEGGYLTTDGNFTICNGGFASGKSSHAEGVFTTASGTGSHAEGVGTSTNGVLASGNGSHAEGYSTSAIGSYSHAGGYYTSAVGNYQTVIGKYNSPNTTDAFQIGWGTGAATTARKNVFAVNQNGDTTIADAVTLKYNSTTQSLDFVFS